MTDEEAKAYRYRCKYRVEFVPGGVTAEEAAVETSGAGDAIVLINIVQPPGEKGRQMVISHNGFTGKDLSGSQLWRAWFVMAAQLMRDTSIGPLPRSILMMVLGAGQGIPGNERAPDISVEQYQKEQPREPGEKN